MVDFLMRECRAVVDGTICVLRYHSSIFSLSHFFTLIHKTFGTCGTPQTNIPIGTVVVSDSSFLIRRNPDHWITPSIAAYDISRPVVADTDLTELVSFFLLCYRYALCFFSILIVVCSCTIRCKSILTAV